MELAACSGGAPWGTVSWVHWRPSSLVQSGSGAQAGSAIHLGGPCGPALPATAKPSAAAQLLAPPPARASSSSASEAAARSPRRLRAPSPPAGRSFLSPLLLTRRRLAATSLLRFAKCPWPPRASRCREVSGGQRISGRRIWSLRIAAAAAARRPREAPARSPKLEGGGPRLGHRSVPAPSAPPRTPRTRNPFLV